MKADDPHVNKPTFDSGDIHKNISNNITTANSYRQYIIDMVKNIYDPAILKYIYELTSKYYNRM